MKFERCFAPFVVAFGLTLMVLGLTLLTGGETKAVSAFWPGEPGGPAFASHDWREVEPTGATFAIDGGHWAVEDPVQGLLIRGIAQDREGSVQTVREDATRVELQADYSTETKLLAPDGAEGDEFGCAASISGDILVAGACCDDDNGVNSGSAYIFERNEGGIDNWGEVVKLTASDAEAHDYFGNSVAISGNTLVVAADGQDGAGIERGAAYVFERNEGGEDSWGEVTKLIASDAADYDMFGYSVAISGDTIVVGGDAYLYRANYEEGAGTDLGAAYVFERNAGGENNWGEVVKLTASDAEDYDMFGSSVAISGDTIVVGAFGMDTDRGAAYVFERNEGGMDNWGQVIRLTASNAEELDKFGNSVSISGDTIVVGASGEDGAGDNCGAAYVFERNEGGEDNWGEVTKLTASDAQENDWFGESVSISGDIIVVGASGEDGEGDDCGAAYVYERNEGGEGNWGEVAKLTASDAESRDWFGGSVGVSEDTIVAGARGKDGGFRGCGAVYVYYDTTGRILFLPLILVNS